MPRACVIVLDAVGAGELPDAADFGDEGSDTLGNVARAVGGLDLPTLEALGLGNVEPLARLPAAAGRARRRRPAARALARQGHDDRPLGADGDPHAAGDADLPARLPGRGDRPVHEPDRARRARQRAGERDGDHPGARRGASAHRQVDRLHERRLGLPDRRARGDDPARGAVRGLPRRARDPHRQARGRPRDRAARSSASPATTSARRTGTTSRSSRRGRTTCRCCAPAGRRSTASGRSATSSPARTSTSRSRRSRTSRASSGPRSCCARSTTGFVFANLVETDMLWGHRNDPENFHRCLQDFDRRLPDLLDALREGDLLILTSDHGCDPTTPSTDHSREHALLLAYVQGRNAAGRVLRGRRVRRRRRDRERVARRQHAAARHARQAVRRASDAVIRPAELIQRKRDGEELARRRDLRARPRLRARRGARLPDGRVLHGRLLPRPLDPRDVRADRRDDPERRDARPRRARSAARSSTSTRPAGWGTRPRSPSARSSPPAACRSGR